VCSFSKIKKESSGRRSGGSWRHGVASWRKERKIVPSKDEQEKKKKKKREPDLNGCKKGDSMTR